MDGHEVGEVHETLERMLAKKGGGPQILIADTVKGKGVASLEGQHLCHVFNIKPSDIDDVIAGLK